MSMIEHAVGVVSLDRFAEISHMDHDEIGALLLDTMAENAKLRELVKDLYEMAYPECPSAFEAAFADRMSELGIEVDD